MNKVTTVGIDLAKRVFAQYISALRSHRRLSSLLHNSLHGAGAYTELAGNSLDAHTLGPCDTDLTLNSCRYSWPAQFFALRLGSRKTSFNPLLNHAALKLYR